MNSSKSIKPPSTNAVSAPPTEKWPFKDVTLSPTGMGVEFVMKYAEEHQYFVSQEILDLYKASNADFEPEKGWRTFWAGVMNTAVKAGYIVKAGVSAPSSRASHAATTTRWMSRIFKGEAEIIESGRSIVEQVRKDFIAKKYDMRTAFWKVYELAYAQGQRDKADEGK